MPIETSTVSSRRRFSTISVTPLFVTIFSASAILCPYVLADVHL
jgi:hypothetical protein